MKAYLKITLMTAAALVAFGAISFARTTITHSKTSSGDAWMGVYTQTLDRELAREFNLKSDKGVVVNDVVKDSPADKAGLKEEDVILSANGTALESSDDLSDAVSDAKPGDKMTLAVERDGREMQITVTLGDRSDNPDKPFVFRSPGHPQTWAFNFSNDDDGGYIGVQLTDLTTQLGDYFGVSHGNGVLISEVEKDSPAEKAGLKAGDIIVSVDKEDISDSQDIRDMIQDKDPGSSVSLGIMRDHASRTISVEIEKRKEPSVMGYNFKMPRVPKAPSMKGLYLGNSDNEYMDSREFKKQMEELREQMSQLKEQLKDNEGWRDQLKELQEELRTLQKKLQ